MLAALGHGVPLLIVPGQQDKPMVARNMRAAGVARVVPARRATAEHLRSAAEDIMVDQEIAARVRDIEHQIAEAGGAARAAEGIEDLLGRA